MNQSRRQFFRTVAATVAGVVAVDVAPRVIRGESEVVVANGIDCDAPLRWENYYKDYPELNQKQIEIIEKCFRRYEWVKYHDPLICFPKVKK